MLRRSELMAKVPRYAVKKIFGNEPEEKKCSSSRGSLQAWNVHDGVELLGHELVHVKQ